MTAKVFKMSETNGFSVRDLINSGSYEKQAESWAKVSIFTAFAVAIYVGIWGSFSLGWHWLWVIPTLLIGSSLLIAMPTMLVQVWLASFASRHMEYVYGQKPRPKNAFGKILTITKNMWGIAVIFAEIWLVHEFLKWVSTF
ncbi:hypothetical protein [Micavibrio aeruginosavorus]|uniref:hypothetical protein n=1 Tax=Micavibrio aeruginosavorus TaxID=349221 RepID=UPI003F4ACF06